MEAWPGRSEGFAFLMRQVGLGPSDTHLGVFSEPDRTLWRSDARSWADRGLCLAG